MTRKDRIDAAGALALVGFSLLLAFNQVVIRVVNEGLQPVFFAGVRSVGVVLCLWLWFAVRRRPLGLKRKDLFFGCLMGTLFALEFVFLFVALDLTTVSRTSVLFNTMPCGWRSLLTCSFQASESPASRLPVRFWRFLALSSRLSGVVTAGRGRCLATCWPCSEPLGGLRWR